VFFILLNIKQVIFLGNFKLKQNNSMQSRYFSIHFNLEETITRVISSRQITAKDKQQLKIAFLGHENLAEDEITLIDRILYGVRHGILEIVE